MHLNISREFSLNAGKLDNSILFYKLIGPRITFLQEYLFENISLFKNCIRSKDSIKNPISRYYYNDQKSYFRTNIHIRVQNMLFKFIQNRVRNKFWIFRAPRM